MPHYPSAYLADGNSLQAVAEYRRRCPDRRLPHHSTFVDIHRQFREKGLRKTPRESAINLDVRTDNRIMNLITEDPTLSSRAVARLVNVNVCNYVNPSPPGHPT